MLAECGYDLFASLRMAGQPPELPAKNDRGQEAAVVCRSAIHANRSMKIFRPRKSPQVILRGAKAQVSRFGKFFVGFTFPGENFMHF
jgi:hypothetical protein